MFSGTVGIRIVVMIPFTVVQVLISKISPPLLVGCYLNTLQYWFVFVDVFFVCTCYCDATDHAAMPSQFRLACFNANPFCCMFRFPYQYLFILVFKCIFNVFSVQE